MKLLLSVQLDVYGIFYNNVSTKQSLEKKTKEIWKNIPYNFHWA